MTQTDTVRRHPNGAIDLDFYRAGATALRRQAMRDASTVRKAFAGALVTMGVLGLAVGVAALPRSVPTVTATAAPAGIVTGWTMQAHTAANPL